jgi:hypothetical protein
MQNLTILPLTCTRLTHQARQGSTFCHNIPCGVTQKELQPPFLVQGLGVHADPWLDAAQVTWRATLVISFGFSSA